jgi:hypothetical protein
MPSAGGIEKSRSTSKDCRISRKQGEGGDFMARVSATGREGYTGELWRSIEGLYAEILAHPFLQGLIAGTLAKDRFRFYVVQSSGAPPGT